MILFADAFNTELYVCFVDFRRAFDCVNRKIMFYKLLRLGYSSRTLRLTMNMHSKTKSKVKLNGFVSKDVFDEILGVAQGGILSPYIFKSFYQTCLLCFAQFMVLQ